MKIRNSNKEIQAIQVQTGSGCCGPKPTLNTVKVETVQTSCCGTGSNTKTVEEKSKTGGCC